MNGLTSQNILSVDDEEIPGKALDKGGARVSS